MLEVLHYRYSRFYSDKLGLKLFALWVERAAAARVTLTERQSATKARQPTTTHSLLP
ncbi:MAG: hypothetical protein ACI8Z0_002632 [Lentimonas sp.]|jgi:hypothetical protein